MSTNPPPSAVESVGVSTDPSSIFLSSTVIVTLSIVVVVPSTVRVPAPVKFPAKVGLFSIFAPVTAAF